MNHDDHVRLIRDGVTGGGSMWADLGSGGGAFTLALADLLGAGGHVYSVDTDERALREQRQALQARFPAAMVEQRTADFTRPLDLPPLDGVVMANSLHFQRHKEPVLRLVRDMLKPRGRLVLVEYNADKGNWWVPYPLSYPTWEKLARANGFIETRLLATVPSRFLREIYSALSRVP
ncbi:MAG: class I SAM-dependent methyltransferase [Nitrososphaerota archaeon]